MSTVTHTIENPSYASVDCVVTAKFTANRDAGDGPRPAFGTSPGNPVFSGNVQVEVANLSNWEHRLQGVAFVRESGDTVHVVGDGSLNWTGGGLSESHGSSTGNLRTTVDRDGGFSYRGRYTTDTNHPKAVPGTEHRDEGSGIATVLVNDPVVGLEVTLDRAGRSTTLTFPMTDTGASLDFTGETIVAEATAARSAGRAAGKDAGVTNSNGTLS